MPDMKRLFSNVGVSLIQDKDKVAFGATVENNIISENPIINASAYNSGLEKGDKLIQIGSFTLNNLISIDKTLNKYKPNDKFTIIYERFGEIKETSVTLQEDSSFTISPFEASGLELDDAKKANRDAWLNSKE